MTDLTELDQALAKAFASEGKQQDVNQAHLTFLRSSFFVPVKKTDPTLNHIDEQEPFSPLFAKVNDHFFMLAFDTMERLTNWAGNQFNQMDYVEIQGHDIILGISERAFLSVNVGTTYHKEFSPEEIKHLKTVVSKINQLKNT